MTNYALGANKERELKRILEETGFYVIRSAGSHGIVDLLAGNGRVTLAIQVKTESSEFTSDDRFALTRAADKLRALAIIARHKHGADWDLRDMAGTRWTLTRWTP